MIYHLTLFDIFFQLLQHHFFLQYSICLGWYRGIGIPTPEELFDQESLIGVTGLEKFVGLEQLFPFLLVRLVNPGPKRAIVKPLDLDLPRGRHLNLL